ncbi:hypothetical protein Gohar_005510, partial [Gossypium harknessii]|nr:hypothetical protein [Gossypium harknessii]
MDTKVVSRAFAGSLPVDNAQALASKNLKNIPSRYIRPEVEFVLINHGIADELIEKIKIDTQEFFKFPLEEKMAYAQLPNEIEGYGQTLVRSVDQKLDWSDMLFLFPLAVPLRNMRFWPTNPPSFRETFDKYSTELHKVTIYLINRIAKNLGTDPEMLSSIFEDGAQAIRTNYYPPCAEVPVKPIPGALIVNIGDIIEEKERLSMAAFHSPKVGTEIGPLADL